METEPLGWVLRLMMHRAKCLFPLLLLLVIPPVQSELPPISTEWKQRATESLRHHITNTSRNPFAAHIESSTATVPQTQALNEATVPLLSSLTGLLTQAATETLSLSREIRPDIDWPKPFWNLGETEESSWQRRFDWFQNEMLGGVDGASAEVSGASGFRPQESFIETTPLQIGNEP